MKRFLSCLTLAFLLFSGSLFAEEYAASTNFTVTAHSKEFASRVAEKAEQCRHELAIEWLGAPLPGNWDKPCEVTCILQSGNGGATRFTFHDGEVFGWRMEVRGTEEGILNDTIPHEVNHTIFASYFRRPLPRWLDEGAAMLAETPGGVKHCVEALDSPRSFASTLDRRDYPKDQTVLALYGQGFLMTSFLVERCGKPAFVKFANDAKVNGWDSAFSENYGFKGTEDAESQWREWLVQRGTYSDRGSPYSNEPTPYRRSQRTKTELKVFTSPWCAPCSAWKNQYYHNPSFRKKVDAKYYVTFHDANESYASEYGFTGVPAFVVGDRTIHQGYTNERAWFKGVGIGIGSVGIGAGVVVPPRPFIPRGNWEPDDATRGDIDDVDWNAVTLVLAVNTKIPLFTEKRAANVDRIEQKIRQATLENGIPCNVRILSRVLDQAAYDQFAYDAGIDESLVNRIHPVLLVPALAGGGLKGFAVGKLSTVIEGAIEGASPLSVITEREQELRYQKCRQALYAYSPDMGDYAGEQFGGLSAIDLILIFVTALVVAKINLLETLVGLFRGLMDRVSLPRLEWD